MEHLCPGTPPERSRPGGPWRWGGEGTTRFSLSAPQKAKFTFLRCAILLKWEFRKELFSKLAWGHGLGAENYVFTYMVRRRQGGGVGRVQSGSCRNGLAPSTL